MPNSNSNFNIWWDTALSELVWKPCMESLSPFFPFHMFTVGAHGIYVRTDGVIFT